MYWPQREKRYAGTWCQIQHAGFRQGKNHVHRTKQKASRRRPCNERVQHGKRVVQTCPKQPNTDNQRRINAAQCLIKIRTVLIGNQVNILVGEGGLGRLAESKSPMTALGTCPYLSAVSAPLSAATSIGAMLKASERSPAVASPPPSSVTGSEL
jgi:hypothetical protein